MLVLVPPYIVEIKGNLTVQYFCQEPYTLSVFCTNGYDEDAV